MVHIFFLSGVLYQGTLTRAILLSGVFDLPARAMVLNSKQFNGEYGCSTCLEPGVQTKNLKGNDVHTYPFQADTESGFHELRTHQKTVDDSLNASKNKPIKGLKGYSNLDNCEGLDMIRGLAADYMHAYALGVLLMLFKLFTLRQYKDFPWYIGDKIDVLNRRLQSITPPSCIGRWPTNFEEISKWKASENKNVGQFGILAITKGILPHEHFEHLTDLVDAIHLLLSDSIAPADLEVARSLLCDFCRNFPILYDPCFETANVHSLLHLCDKVKDLGPLYEHSAFFYEDLNKDLRDMFCGTRSVHNQVLEAVTIQNQLPILAKKLAPESEVLALYDDMTTHHKIKSELIKIAPRAYSIGTYRQCMVKEPLKTTLETLYGPDLIFQRFDRIRLGRAIVHSIGYRESHTQRNNCTISYSSNGSIQAGQVKFFLEVTDRNSTTKYVAIVRQLEATGQRLGGFLYEVRFRGQEVIVPVQDLGDLSLYIDNGENAYVVKFPNTVERE